MVNFFKDFMETSIGYKILVQDDKLKKLVRKMFKVLLLSPIAYNSKLKAINGEDSLIIFQKCYALIIEKKMILHNDLIHDICTSLNDYDAGIKSISLLIISFADDSKTVFEFLITFFKELVTKHCMTKSSSKSEGSALKNFRDFFSLIAPVLVDILEKNLTTFLYMFDSPSYMLRNSVVDILKNILMSNYAQFDEDDPLMEQKMSRKTELITWIIGRQMDASPYGRGFVLSSLMDLYSMKMFSQAQIFEIFSNTCDRINDRASQVRKKAIALVAELVIFFVESLSYHSYDIIDEDIERVTIELQTCSLEEDPERYNTLKNYRGILVMTKKVYNKME